MKITIKTRNPDVSQVVLFLEQRGFSPFKITRSRYIVTFHFSPLEIESALKLLQCFLRVKHWNWIENVEVDESESER